MNNEIKCPNCNNLIQLDQANFCGMCGENIMNIKQQHFQQMHQQQMHQQQMHQQQMHQQQMYQQQKRKNNIKNYNNLDGVPLNVKFSYYTSKFLFFILLFILLFRCSSHLNDFLINNVSNFGIDPSLFYSYFSEKVDDVDGYYSAGGVSAQEYNKLETGMSYALTSFIIGGDGDLVNTGENVHNKFYYTYRWFSEIDENLVYYITFIDDEISEIMLDQK